MKVIITLLEKVNGIVKKRGYRGVWVLTDNGYLPWSVTMPPSKYPTSTKELRWSQWLESMRKDVECFFGILKKRFKILLTDKAKKHNFSLLPRQALKARCKWQGDLKDFVKKI